MKKPLNEKEKTKIRNMCFDCTKWFKGKCTAYLKPYPLWGEGICSIRNLKPGSIDRVKDLPYEGWEDVYFQEVHGRPGLKFGRTEGTDGELFSKARMKDNRIVDERGQYKDIERDGD